VEYWGPVVGFDLKGGEGPDDLREFFRRAAERLALQEAGEEIDQAFDEAEFDNLRRRVGHYFLRSI